MAIHLRRLPGHVTLYFGTLNVFGPVGLADHKAIREAFREGIPKRLGPGVQFEAVAEVGRDDDRLHYHYAMWSDGPEVSHADVVALLRAACDGLPVNAVNVDHGEMRSPVAVARYLYKPGFKHYAPGSPKPVKLLARGTGRITWGTRGFFPKPVQDAIWAEKIAEWYGKPAEVEVEVQTPNDRPMGSHSIPRRDHPEDSSTPERIEHEHEHEHQVESPAVAPVTPRSTPSTQVLAAARRWMLSRRPRTRRSRGFEVHPARGAGRPGRHQRDASPAPRSLSRAPP